MNRGDASAANAIVSRPSQVIHAARNELANAQNGSGAEALRALLVDGSWTHLCKSRY